MIAVNKIDMLICVGEEAKNIAQKAIEEGMSKSQITLCQNNEEAIQILKKTLNNEDAVLLKASNGLKFIEICEAIC